MKHFINCICLFLCFNTYSQTTLWEVKGKGENFFIGGTIHVLRDQDYPLPKQFDEAYAKADKLVFETNEADLQKPEVAMLMMRQGMYMDERTLKTALSSSVYDSLKMVCTASGLPLANLNKFKPSMAIITLTVVKLQQMGVSAKGVDKNYFAKGTIDKKQFDFLETAQEQINMIAKMGEGNEDDFVRQSLKDFETMTEDMPAMIKCWRDGSGTVLLEQLKDFKTHYPKLYNDLLVTRNNNWLPKLDAYLDTPEKELVLVGALHLFGPDGCIEQLKAKGYVVTQVQ